MEGGGGNEPGKKLGISLITFAILWRNVALYMNLVHAKMLLYKEKRKNKLFPFNSRIFNWLKNVKGGGVEAQVIGVELLELFSIFA